MSVEGGPNIVEAGLVFYVDPANPRSYISGSLDTFDLINSTVTGSLINDVSFSFNSWNFDGVDDSIDCNIITELNGAPNATWSCWLKRLSPISGYYTMGTWGNSGTDRQMVLFQTSTYIRILIGDSTGYDTAFQCNLTADTDWHNVVITYDGSLSNILKVKVYYDGSPLTPNTATGTNVTNLNVSLNGFTIGKLGSGTPGVNDFNGNISNIPIYNVTLSQTEVLQNYNALKNRFK